MALETVSKEQALKVPPSAPVAAAKPAKVRFVKSMGPGEPVPIADGRTITFNVPVNNQTGEPCAYGWFETTDANEIAALRKLSAEQPHHYIFEQ